MKSLPRLAWVLLGLLVIAGVMISLGRTSNDTNPDAASFGPSGTRALRDLLEREGYSTSINTSATPLLDPSDVAIGFYFGGMPLFFNQDSGGDNPPSTPTALSDAATKIVTNQLNQGGKAILFDLDQDFRTSSQTANATIGEASNTPGQTSLPLKVNMATRVLSLEYGASDEMKAAVDSQGETIATAKFHKTGTLIEVQDGIIATNRFIDKNDNALEVMKLIRMIAPPGAHLVFTEATFGHISEPGLLELIGPWAEAAWWQLIALGLVVVYTLGKPFGYPDEERVVQRGTRDFVDAVALTYRRSKATQVALQRLHAYADREIRAKLKLPSDASDADRNRQIPSDLANSLQQASACSFYRIKDYDALKIAELLDQKTRDFIGPTAKRAKRRKFTQT